MICLRAYGVRVAMLHSQPLKSEAFHFPLVQGLILVVKLTMLRNAWKTSKYTPPGASASVSREDQLEEKTHSGGLDGTTEGETEVVVAQHSPSFIPPHPLLASAIQAALPCHTTLTMVD